VKWWILFVVLTVSNVGYDWILGRLGPSTVTWECATISTLLVTWCLRKIGFLE